jgi:fructokinase
MADTFGAVELGGTSIRVMLADESENILSQTSFPTQEAKPSRRDIIHFFHSAQSELGLRIRSLGIASFGPLDLRPDSKTYGHITSTPKPGWAFFNIKHELEGGLGVEAVLDTDVNAAALGEFSRISTKNIRNLAYITVGTGIGAGFIINGMITHGLVHPEFGHTYIPHDKERDPFDGICPYHKDCLEGMASGPAVQKRWSVKPENLPEIHPAWELEGQYLAYAAANLVCTISPEIIVLGGGVMSQQHLYPTIRDKTRKLLNGYIHSETISSNLDEYIRAPMLGGKAGLIGALLLAKMARKSTLV